MKNTKHTENLDNSTPQEITSQSKRKILTSIGVSSGILGASALSQQWTKPIVNSIILPAHAQSTPMMTTMMMTTMGMSTTKPAMDDMDMTTMAPTDPPAPASRIMVSTDNMGTIGDASTGDPGVATYNVRLSEMPSSTVTVMVTAGTGVDVAAVAPATLPLMFNLNDYSEWKQFTVTAAGDDVPKDTEVTVTLKASGGGYDEMREEMITVINDDAAPPTMVMAKAGDFNFTANTADVTVTWKHPDTSAERRGYVISSDRDKPEDMRVGPDAEMVEFKGVPAGAHVFSVMVDFKEVADATVDADSITIG